MLETRCNSSFSSGVLFKMSPIAKQAIEISKGSLGATLHYGLKSLRVNVQKVIHTQTIKYKLFNFNITCS